MWSFFKQKKDEQQAINNKPNKPMEFAELVSSMGDLSDLAIHDAALKFWAPEPAEKALVEICNRNGESLSASLRQFFILHCYGLYAYHTIQDLIPGFCKKNHGEIKYSIKPETKKRIATYWVVELGKNVAPIKVWVPKRVKNDLTTLATHVGLTTSNYVREIVISRLLGHGMLPKRPEIFSANPLPDAEIWAEDRDPCWKQVTEEESRRYRLMEQRVTTSDG